MFCSWRCKKYTYKLQLLIEVINMDINFFYIFLGRTAAYVTEDIWLQKEA